MFSTPWKHEALVADFVAPQLEPGEQVEATLSSAHIGSMFKAAWPLFGPLLFGGRLRPCALVVTDRRVLVIELSKWTTRPRSIQAAYPREGARAAWKDHFTSQGLEISWPDGSALKLEIPQGAFYYQGQNVIDTLNEADETGTGADSAP